jgi:hypothetical protein
MSYTLVIATFVVTTSQSAGAVATNMIPGYATEEKCVEAARKLQPRHSSGIAAEGQSSKLPTTKMTGFSGLCVPAP